MLERDASSYRDPHGYIAYEGKDVYRCITNDNAPVIQSKYKAFFETATKKELLVPFKSVAPVSKDTEQNINKLKLHKLPFVSYPYEWGFEQLKDAALVTLDICLLALDHGLTLKDATAFNVQQYNGRMIFIDHTSFEPSDNMLPWKPYSQFCRHFLVPLLVTSRRGYHAGKRFRTELDGLDLQEACLALPFTDFFKPAVFFHIYLHNWMINSHKKSNDLECKKNNLSKRSGTQGSQKLYIEHLRKVINKIKPPQYATEWHDYYNTTNYNDEAFKQKEIIIESLAMNKRYKCIWDVGGNNGHFSRLMAGHVETVISMDIDYAAIDLNYKLNKQKGITNIYPLVMDLTNPSPALGFGNQERKTIEQRSCPDLIVALALVHHLTITYNVPFALLAAQLQKHSADICIEYVGRQDSQFQKLMLSKDEEYRHYNQDEFETCFQQHFALQNKKEIKGTHRILYHFTPKSKA